MEFDVERKKQEAIKQKHAKVLSQKKDEMKETNHIENSLEIINQELDPQTRVSD